MAITLSKSDQITIVDSPSLFLPETYLWEDADVEFTDDDVIWEGKVTLRIEVSESVGIADAPGNPAVILAGIEISESISIQQAIETRLAMLINVSELATLAELTATQSSDLEIDLSDAISVADSITVDQGARAVNVSDAVGLAELASAELGDLLISLSDAAALSEAVTLGGVGFPISSSEGISTGDAVTVSLSDLSISVSDACSLTESAGTQTGAEYTWADADVTFVDEDVEWVPKETLKVSVYDDIVLDDENGDVQVSGETLDLAPSVSEALAVASSPAVVLANLGPCTASDDAQLSEACTLSLVSSASCADGISLGEAVSLTFETSVSVSDVLAVADSVATSKPDLIGSVSDAIAIAEDITSTTSIPDAISVSDGVSVADSPTVSIGLRADPQISVYESISVNAEDGVYVQTEYVPFEDEDVPWTDTEDHEWIPHYPRLYVGWETELSDSISVGESVDAEVGATDTLNPGVADSVSVGESLGVENTELYRSRSDSISVAEDSMVTVLGVGSIGTSRIDSVSVTDSPTVAISTLPVSVSDQIGVSWPPAGGTGLVTSLISVSDAVSVADSPTLYHDEEHRSLSVSDELTLGDLAAGVVGTIILSVSDATSIADSASGEFEASEISVSDGVSLGEAITTAPGDLGDISVADSVSVSEDSDVTTGDYLVELADSVSVADTASGALSLQAAVSDAVSVADSPTVFQTTGNSTAVHDSVTVSEAVTVHGDLSISASSSVSVLDVAGSNVSLLLRFQSDDGSTTPDSSTNQLTAYVENGAYVVGGVCYFDGDDDQVRIASDSALDLGTSEFTIDFYFKLDDVSEDGSWIRSLVARSDGYISIYLSKTAGGLYILTAVITGDSITAYNITVANDTWYHVAVIRGWSGDADTLAITFDGSTYGVGATGTAVASSPSNADLRIVSGTVTASDIPGYVDNFRIVKGAALWTEEFTPPAAPYIPVTSVSFESFVDVSDAASIADDPTVGAVAFTPSPADAVSVSEAVTLDVSDPAISVSDSISAADDAAVEITEDLNRAVSSQVSISESVSGKVSGITLSTPADSITVSDSPSVLLYFEYLEIHMSASAPEVRLEASKPEIKFTIDAPDAQSHIRKE